MKQLEEKVDLAVQDINKLKMEIYIDNLTTTFGEIQEEIVRAKTKYPKNFNSSHEAYAVILEEIDELWDEIKKREHDKDKMKTEAIQCAAMLCRLLVELL